MQFRKVDREYAKLAGRENLIWRKGAVQNILQKIQQLP